MLHRRCQERIPQPLLRPGHAAVADLPYSLDLGGIAALQAAAHQQR